MKSKESRLNDTEIFRDNLQNMFDLAFSSGDYNSLREHYAKLRNIEFNIHFTSVKEQINISALIENLTLACDIVVADMGVNFIFCGNETSHIIGNSKALTKAFLNMLSNAYLHGKGNLITVKTVETSEHIRIEVKNEGRFSACEFKNGLSFVCKFCQNTNGVFLIETDKFSTNSVMCIKKHNSLKHQKFSVPYFYDYLNDKLSPVYIEMFGMTKS